MSSGSKVNFEQPEDEDDEDVSSANYYQYMNDIS